jgi:hypothetical protein
MMVYMAYFAAGLFLTNGVPHFVNGISGRRFQSPFASPPGVGESPPLVNVLWGMANFVVGYLLIAGLGKFQFGLTLDAFAFGLGAASIALVLSWHFGRVRSGKTMENYKNNTTE